MRILHFMPYATVPTDFGGAIRVHNLLRAIAGHHEVHVLMYGGEQGRQLQINAFGGSLRSVTAVDRRLSRRVRRLLQFAVYPTKRSYFNTLGWSRRMQEALEEQLSRRDFDLVLTEFSHMGSFKYDSGAVKILDAHNLEFDLNKRLWECAHTLPRRLHYAREYKKLMREEIEAFSRHDAVLFTSERDREIAAGLVHGLRGHVVPNGVDMEYFVPNGGQGSNGHQQERASLVFTGTMQYTPNWDAMVWFLDEIFPLILREIPGAKIYIVGKLPPAQLVKRAASNVVITGRVDDVRPYIDRSSVYVVPLRMGGGTRLKLSEAFAMHKPVVSTTVGCEGLNVEDGVTALIADDPAAFAWSVVRLLRDGDLRRRLSDNGYELARQEYDWRTIGTRFENLLTRIVGREKTQAARGTVTGATAVQVG